LGGDVIIAIDDQPVQSFDDLLIYIATQTTPGQDVSLTILRDGKTQVESLYLETRPRE
jgi:S1-C subfamily serine protease